MAFVFFVILFSHVTKPVASSRGRYWGLAPPNQDFSPQKKSLTQKLLIILCSPHKYFLKCESIKCSSLKRKLWFIIFLYSENANIAYAVNEWEACKSISNPLTLVALKYTSKIIDCSHPCNIIALIFTFSRHGTTSTTKINLFTNKWIVRQWLFNVGLL